MSISISSEKDRPWNVPVVVCPGSFDSLYPEHQECNVVVSPTAAGSFGVGQNETDSSSLLFADLQTNLYGNIAGRLGSGRSGFYRDWYLKGVGRTPLAANWNQSDHLHNTGHLAASSAIREFVASVYLKQIGCDSTIVPCEGVLVTSLDPSLKKLGHLLYSGVPDAALPAVDSSVQAITVKRRGFTRISNFVWLLHHLTPFHINDGRTSLATFAKLLLTTARPPGEPRVDQGEIGPEGLARVLKHAVDKACEHFQEWFHQGIWWGSFTNNFTVDGRFLDLETPAIVGGAAFGQLTSKDILERPTVRSEIFGIEIFGYLVRMKWFCEKIVQLLTQLPPTFGSVEREFSSAFAHEVEKQLLASDSYLVSQDRAVSLVHNALLEDQDWSAASRATLRRVLDHEWKRRYLPESATCNDGSAPTLPPLEPLEDLPPLLTEPGALWRLGCFRFDSGESLTPSPAARDRARGIRELILELDAATHPDALLAKLSEVESRVREISKTSRGIGIETVTV